MATIDDRKNGWIKLHKKLLKNPAVMKDADHLALWTYILLHAVWEPTSVWFNGEKITLEPGQFTTGSKRIAQDLRVSRSKVERVLSCFKSEQQIEQQTCPSSRLITVKKWKDYQNTEQPFGQRTDNERTTNGQRTDTNKEYKNIRNKEDRDIATSVANHADIVSVFDAFKAINPVPEYGNKTQRKAISDLLAAHGLEKVLGAATYAVSVQSERFAPVITNPWQLKKKLPELIAYKARSDKSSKSLVLEI